MLEDHVGRVYGRWTVIGVGATVRGAQHLKCVCICGKVKDVRVQRAIDAKSACRCVTEFGVGMVFGRLTVVSKAPTVSRAHSARWDCKCDCGETCTVYQTNLTRSLTLSCGCLQSERRTTHGKSNSKTYAVWVAMKQRTTNPNMVVAYNYMDRGIDLCESWHTFENFLADMGEQPKGLTLDRLDNSKGYSKENCAWITQAAQTRNTRRNVNITAFGETKCITDWAAQFDLSCNTIKRRIEEWGWSNERAVSAEPPCIGRRAQMLRLRGQA